jgi:hypothetical protein
MEIVEDRHGRGSTLITSQLPVTSWHDVIGLRTVTPSSIAPRLHCVRRRNVGRHLGRVFRRGLRLPQCGHRTPSTGGLSYAEVLFLS